MDAREKRRLALARRAALSLPDKSLPFGVGRDRPIVAVLADDTVGLLFDLIDRYCPEGTNVVTELDATFVVLTARRTPAEDHFGSEEGDWAIPPAMPIRTLVEVVRSSGHSMRCRLMEPGYLTLGAAAA